MHRIGHGEHAVLCLHGWYGHADGWGLLPAVVDGDAFTYHFPEMRGYGRRRDETGDYTMWEYAADALAAADAAGLDRFSVLGHSMGGKAGAALVAQAPNRVRALVGLSAVWPGPVPMEGAQETLFFGAPEDPDKRYAIIDLTTGNRHSRHWIRQMVDDSLATSTTEAFTGAVQSWVQDDYLAEVGTIKVPSLFLTGENDPALSAEGARATWSTIAPEAEIHELAAAGHYATHETPVALVTALEDFLRAH